MTDKQTVHRCICYASALLLLILSSSCGTYRTLPASDEEKHYQKIIIQTFEIDPALGKIYPGAVVACESTAINELLKKSSLSKIEKARTGTSREMGAVIVKAYISGLKMTVDRPSGTGSSSTENAEMAVNLKFIDAASGHKIHDITIPKNVNTANTQEPRTGSERHWPYDLGGMVAEYINEVVQGNFR